MSSIVRVYDVRVPGNRAIPVRSHELRARPHVPKPKAMRTRLVAAATEVAALNRNSRIHNGNTLYLATKRGAADLLAALRLEFARLDALTACRQALSHNTHAA